MKRLVALLALIALPLAAQTPKDSARVSLDSVLSHQRQYCRSKSAARYVCHDTLTVKRVEVSLAPAAPPPVVVPPVVVPPAPPVVVPPAASGPSDTLAAATFEDGTLGSFVNVWGYGIDVIADPTPRAQGKVVRIHYANNPAAGSLDANLAVCNAKSFAIGLGQYIAFQGDFYVDKADWTMRKLFIWGVDGNSAPVVTLLQGNTPTNEQLVIAPNQNHPEWTNYTSAFVTLKAWHRVKVELRMNSSPTALDGMLNVWLDGALAGSIANLAWIEARNPAAAGITSVCVGYQAQAGTSQVDEYRYWDNLIFSRSPIP